MTSTFGAPLGGTIRGGQYGMESSARFSIRPPNGAGGVGSDLPLIVVVALGAPGTPGVCWALAAVRPRTISTTRAMSNVLVFIITFSMLQAFSWRKRSSAAPVARAALCMVYGLWLHAVS